MLKKTITYEDFNGKTVSENFFFHLSKADLIELEVSHKDGLAETITRIVKEGDGGAIIKEFKKLILSSVGERSENGTRFIKTDAIREDFQSSEAFSTLFVELCTDADAASEFINGIVPAGLEAEVAKIGKPQDASEAANTSAAPTAPKTLTQAEMVEMDADELKSGLATGRYIIGA